jgi:hypothetical protein
MSGFRESDGRFVQPGESPWGRPLPMEGPGPVRLLSGWLRTFVASNMFVVDRQGAAMNGYSIQPRKLRLSGHTKGRFMQPCQTVRSSQRLVATSAKQGSVNLIAIFRAPLRSGCEGQRH